MVADLHPLLHERYPVALVEGDTLSIFDLHGDGFRLVNRVPKPEWIIPNIAAAFPLEEHGWRVTCVLDTISRDPTTAAVIVLHEFVHCYQFETCEEGLKRTLEVTRQAERDGHVTWELDHPFPYDRPQVAEAYRDMLAVLERDDEPSVRKARAVLLGLLKPMDAEYLVWQEWKEGFARHIENRLRARLGLPRAGPGSIPPMNRVTLYAGGDALIGFLVRREPRWFLDLEALFHAMFHAMRGFEA